MRTTEAEVKGLIATDSSISLVPFMATANSLVDEVAENDVRSKLNSDRLRLIEAWLSAHFYAIRDQQLASHSTGRASGQFQGQTDEGLRSTHWGGQAVRLDSTGYLARIDEEAKTGGPNKIGAIWLGSLDMSQRIPYHGTES